MELAKKAAVIYGMKKDEVNWKPLWRAPIFATVSNKLIAKNF